MSSLSTKIDFAVILSVHHANPNGDPLNGNRPRTDYSGLGEISDVADVDLDETEANNVAAHRLEVCDAPCVDVCDDRAFHASFARLGAAGLEVAWVDHPRLVRTAAARQDHARVHVAQCPIIEADAAQVVE